MAFWTADLTTQDGALGATQSGGLACFIAAGLTALGLGLQAMTPGLTPATAVGPTLIAMGLECLMFVVAGFRLRAGKGMIWGGVAALLLVLEFVGKLATLTGIGGAVINAVLVVVIVNGVRGARALRSGDLDQEEVSQVFE